LDVGLSFNEQPHWIRHCLREEVAQVVLQSFVAAEAIGAIVIADASGEWYFFLYVSGRPFLFEFFFGCWIEFDFFMGLSDLFFDVFVCGVHRLVDGGNCAV
jgi:hypothetical protein